MQLPLPIHQVDDDSFDNFYAENSLMLLESLRQNFANVQQPFFYIWGGKSSGKSHLLKAVFNHYLNHDRTASYVPLEKSSHCAPEKSYAFTPEILENADQLDVICLDNIQAVAGDLEWELRIFDLFNRIRDQQAMFYTGNKTLLLISADRPPYQLGIQLPDLLSRLNWGEHYQLNDLNDKQKRTILQRYAYQKGLELSDETANFLLKRLDRDLQTLIQRLDELDRASLQAQRKLTVPFVKEILGL